MVEPFTLAVRVETSARIKHVVLIDPSLSKRLDRDGRGSCLPAFAQSTTVRNEVDLLADRENVPLPCELAAGNSRAPFQLPEKREPDVLRRAPNGLN